MGVAEAISGCFKEMWWIAKEEQLLSISEWVSGLVGDGFWVSGPFLLSLAQSIKSSLGLCPIPSQ